MKTIGDVIKKMKEEGQDEGVIRLTQPTVSYGYIPLELKNLEELSPDLTVEEYMEEVADDGMVDWGEERCYSTGDVSLEDVQIG